MLIYTVFPFQTSKDKQIWFHSHQEWWWVSFFSIFSKVSSVRQEVSGTSVIPPRGKFLNTLSFSCATYFSAVSLAFLSHDMPRFILHPHLTTCLFCKIGAFCLTNSSALYLLLPGAESAPIAVNATDQSFMCSPLPKAWKLKAIFR